MTFFAAQRRFVAAWAVLALALSCVACSEQAPDGTADDAGSADNDTESGDVSAASDTQPVASSGSIKVLTYNVHGLPPLISGDDTTGRYKQIAPKLNAYDIVGLQEDFIDDNHKLLVKTVKLPHRSRFDAKLKTPEGELDKVYGSGLSIFSRFAITQSKPEHYGNCNGIIGGASDCLASKGFQFVRLQVGAGSIDVYNTHLEAGGGKDDEAVRAKQVDKLLAAIKKNSAGRAAILLGDMNLKRSDPPDAPQLDKIEAVLTDSCLAVKCGQTDHIDRIFIKSGDKLALTVTSWKNESKDYQDKDGEDLSDHPPLRAVIAWKMKAAR